MVAIPPGAFPFGSTEESFELFLASSTVNYPGMKAAFRMLFVIPPQYFDLPEYLIDKFEVTNQEYSQFLTATGYSPVDAENFLKHWEGSRLPDWAGPFPVVWLSREDAQTYCKWRYYGRLPTEKEWEKASRSEDGRLYPWGNTLQSQDIANFSTEQSEPSGNRPDDRSPYNTFDMGGNVAELTMTQVEQEGQLQVVVKGGSFRSPSREMMTFHRFLVPPNSRSEFIGFRCAVDPE